MKKTTIRIIAAVIAAMMIFAFAGCSPETAMSDVSSMVDEAGSMVDGSDSSEQQTTSGNDDSADDDNSAVNDDSAGNDNAAGNDDSAGNDNAAGNDGSSGDDNSAGNDGSAENNVSEVF